MFLTYRIPEKRKTEKGNLKPKLWVIVLALKENGDDGTSFF
jgi:hypothetical protein